MPFSLKNGTFLTRSLEAQPYIQGQVTEVQKEKALCLITRQRAFFKISRGGRIRTYGLVVPNDARYRAALHPETDAVPMGRLRVGKFQIRESWPKKAPDPKVRGFFVGQTCSSVGVAGFEPTTSSTPCWRDTRLRYTPRELESQR